MNEQQISILQSAISLANIMEYNAINAMLNTILRIEREKVLITEDPQEVYNLEIAGKD